MNQVIKLTKITEKKNKRRGRGGGSGKGFHTTGSGVKGQKSRAGYNKRNWFEGGQNPLVRALPHKKGFKRPTKREVIGINLYKLEKLGKDRLDAKTLRKAFGIPAGASIKILSKGNVSKKIEIEGVAISKGAARKIEKAGQKKETNKTVKKVVKNASSSKK